MKTLSTGLAGLFLLSSLATGAVSPELLKRVLPKGINIDDYPDAKKELIEHLENCGEGVVTTRAAQGAVNRCTYNIELDDYFFKPLKQKTGFIYNSDWPYADGQEWITSTKKDRDALPEKWDLSENSDMIPISLQECGDCWAQATRANLEQLVLTWSMVRAPLSTQTLISSCCDAGTCQGGSMDAPDFLVKYGLPKEERDPYKSGSNSKCKFDLTKDVMDYKLYKAPWVGESLNYSRGLPVIKRTMPHVEDIMSNMYKFDSSAVVTIEAIEHKGGIVTTCSAINSDGNHMQDVVGWYQSGGQLIARLQNSHGINHGQNGYTHLRWECGEGKLNRGMGKEARIGIFTVPSNCILPEPYTGGSAVVNARSAIRIGRASRVKQSCKWLPTEGLSDPNVCDPIANPDITTEYHLTTATDCGRASAMIVVNPAVSSQPGKIRTPYGVVAWSGR